MVLKNCLNNISSTDQPSLLLLDETVPTECNGLQLKLEARRNAVLRNSHGFDQSNQNQLVPSCPFLRRVANIENNLVYFKQCLPSVYISLV